MLIPIVEDDKDLRTFMRHQRPKVRQAWDQSSIQRPNVGKQLKVLIVEDRQDFTDIAMRILRRGGYETACARNGVEALEYLVRNPIPDLILLDLYMPVMDGYEFLARRADIQALADIPVIVTSSERDEARELVRSAHVAGSVPKTFTAETLLPAVAAAVQSWLAKH